MDGIITLIKETYVKDTIGQDIPTETANEVFCEYESIGRSEWVAAGQNSINAEMLVKTQQINYQGERIALVNGERFAIYRTYSPPGSDVIELYLQREAGVL